MTVAELLAELGKCPMDAKVSSDMGLVIVNIINLTSEVKLVMGVKA